VLVDRALGPRANRLGLHVRGEPVHVRYPSRIQGHSDEHPTLGEHLDGVVDEDLRSNELQP